MKLGERLREIRQQRGDTLLQVSRATGLSVSYLSDLERGRTNPSIETLEKLATHFKLDLAGVVANVDGWGMPSLESLPLGLAELVEEKVIKLEEAMDLSRVELRGQRPKTQDEWLSIYYTLKNIVRNYTSEPPSDERE